MASNTYKLKKFKSISKVLLKWNQKFSFLDKGKRTGLWSKAVVPKLERARASP